MTQLLGVYMMRWWDDMLGYSFNIVLYGKLCDDLGLTH